MYWLVVLLCGSLILVSVRASILTADKQQEDEERIIIPVIADIALIIDQSGSIGAHNYEREIDFAQHFVDSFPIGPNLTRIALVEFSLPNMTRVRLNWDQGATTEIVRTTLDQMRHAHLGTGTDFARAWTVVLEQLLQQPNAGDRPEAPNVAVIVTDGYLNSRFEREPAFEAAQRLRSTGTLLYAIHVRLDPRTGKAPIEDLAQMTGNESRVFAVDDFERLTRDLLAVITRQISEEYQDCVFEYEPTGLCYQDQFTQRCAQDTKLKVIRPAQGLHGKPCPSGDSAADGVTVDCEIGACQYACEKWPWGVWAECVVSSGGSGDDMCGENGTKTRNRQGEPPYPQLASSGTCQLTESKACSEKELADAIQKFCVDGRMADKIKGANAPSGSDEGLPVWVIILIALVCFSVISIVIAGVIVYRSPRWRVIFIPNKPRQNQLPGMTNDNAATACL